MSDVERQPAEAREAAPVVTLQRIRAIPTYEVMEADLYALEQVMAGELRAQGFFTLCVGLLIPTVISWGTASSPSATATAVYVSSSLIFALATLKFGAEWWHASKQRPTLLRRIREGGSTVVVTQDMSER